MGGAHHRVSTDPNAGGKAQVAQLIHELVGERTGLRNQTHRAGVGNVGRGDTHIGLSRADNSRAVRANDLGAVGGGVSPKVSGVSYRHALSDNHNQAHTGVDRLNYGALSKSRGHKHYRNLGASGGLTFCYGAINRN